MSRAKTKRTIVTIAPHNNHNNGNGSNRSNGAGHSRNKGDKNKRGGLEGGSAHNNINNNNAGSAFNSISYSMNNGNTKNSNARPPTSSYYGGPPNGGVGAPNNRNLINGSWTSFDPGSPTVSHAAPYGSPAMTHAHPYGSPAVPHASPYGAQDPRFSLIRTQPQNGAHYSAPAPMGMGNGMNMSPTQVPLNVSSKMHAMATPFVPGPTPSHGCGPPEFSHIPARYIPVADYMDMIGVPRTGDPKFKNMTRPDGWFYSPDSGAYVRYDSIPGDRNGSVGNPDLSPPSFNFASPIQAPAAAIVKTSKPLTPAPANAKLPMRPISGPIFAPSAPVSTWHEHSDTTRSLLHRELDILTRALEDATNMRLQRISNLRARFNELSAKEKTTEERKYALLNAAIAKLMRALELGRMSTKNGDSTIEATSNGDIKDEGEEDIKADETDKDVEANTTNTKDINVSKPGKENPSSPTKDPKIDPDNARTECVKEFIYYLQQITVAQKRAASYNAQLEAVRDEIGACKDHELITMQKMLHGFADAVKREIG
jgi:hypothetical protein